MDAEAAASSLRCATSCRRAAKPGRDEETVGARSAVLRSRAGPWRPGVRARSSETFPLAGRDRRRSPIPAWSRAAVPPSTERFDVVVSAGGGAAGASLRGSRAGRGPTVGQRATLAADHRAQPADADYSALERRRRQTSRCAASARISRACSPARGFRSRRPATTRSATSCGPAAARSSCPSPRAARPNRRHAPGAWSSSGWRGCSPSTGLTPALLAAAVRRRASASAPAAAARARSRRRGAHCRAAATVSWKREAARRSDLADQHEARVVLHRQRAGKGDRGQPRQPRRRRPARARS